MFLFYGRNLYAHVDKVPGQFSVATLFLHIYYFPVLPDRSYILRAGKSHEEAIPIPFSMKSVLVAWARAVFIIPAVISSAVLISFLRDGQSTRSCITSAAWLLCTATPFILSYLPGFTRASPARAAWIQERIERHRGHHGGVGAGSQDVWPQGFEVIRTEPPLAQPAPESEYRLFCTDVTTGEAKTFLVWAASERAAREKGSQFGLQVERVEQADATP